MSKENIKQRKFIIAAEVGANAAELTQEKYETFCEKELGLEKDAYSLEVIKKKVKEEVKKGVYEEKEVVLGYELAIKLLPSKPNLSLKSLLEGEKVRKSVTVAGCGCEKDDCNCVLKAFEKKLFLFDKHKHTYSIFLIIFLLALNLFLLMPEKSSFITLLFPSVLAVHLFYVGIILLVLLTIVVFYRDVIGIAMNELHSSHCPGLYCMFLLVLALPLVLGAWMIFQPSFFVMLGISVPSMVLGTTITMLAKAISDLVQSLCRNGTIRELCDEFTNSYIEGTRSIIRLIQDESEKSEPFDQVYKNKSFDICLYKKKERKKKEAKEDNKEDEDTQQKGIKKLQINSKKKLGAINRGELVVIGPGEVFIRRGRVVGALDGKKKAECEVKEFEINYNGESKTLSKTGFVPKGAVNKSGQHLVLKVYGKLKEQVIEPIDVNDGDWIGVRSQVLPFGGIDVASYCPIAKSAQNYSEGETLIVEVSGKGETLKENFKSLDESINPKNIKSSDLVGNWGAIFTGILIVALVITVLIWIFTGNAAILLPTIVMYAVFVLTRACPTSLFSICMGTVLVAARGLRKVGIKFNNLYRVFVGFSDVYGMCSDLTGTLTEFRTIKDIRIDKTSINKYSAFDKKKKNIAQLLLTLESRLGRDQGDDSHPQKIITRLTAGRSVKLKPLSYDEVSFLDTDNAGGQITKDGATLTTGSAVYVKRKFAKDKQLCGKIDEAIENADYGISPIVYQVSEKAEPKLIGEIIYNKRKWYPSSHKLIAKFVKNRKRFVVITGTDPKTARKIYESMVGDVAGFLGISKRGVRKYFTIRGGCSTEDKRKLTEQEKEQAEEAGGKKIIAAGDQLDDAEMLKAADIPFVISRGDSLLTTELPAIKVSSPKGALHAITVFSKVKQFQNWCVFFLLLFFLASLIPASGVLQLVFGLHLGFSLLTTISQLGLLAVSLISFAFFAVLNNFSQNFEDKVEAKKFDNQIQIKSNINSRPTESPKIEQNLSNNETLTDIGALSEDMVALMVEKEVKKMA